MIGNACLLNHPASFSFLRVKWRPIFYYFVASCKRLWSNKLAASLSSQGNRMAIAEKYFCPTCNVAAFNSITCAERPCEVPGSLKPIWPFRPIPTTGKLFLLIQQKVLNGQELSLVMQLKTIGV